MYFENVKRKVTNHRLRHRHHQSMCNHNLGIRNKSHCNNNHQIHNSGILFP